MEDLQQTSEICYDVWFGDGTKKKTGYRAGGGRVENVKISIGNDQYGQK